MRRTYTDLTNRDSENEPTGVMKYAVIFKDNLVQIVSYFQNPLYGKGDWNLYKDNIANWSDANAVADKFMEEKENEHSNTVS